MAEIYPKDDEAWGKFIYREAGIQVNTNPKDIEGHQLWINGRYFVLPHGTLTEIAERGRVQDLEKLLKRFNDMILFTLKENNISTETFALVLARARIKEQDEYASSLVNRLS